MTSAINYGALRAKVAVCLDVRHISHIERGYVPQGTVDNVLTRQIWAHYYNNPKRRLPHHFLLASSGIGWWTFWSTDDRRSIYQDMERRMPPCPDAVTRYREMHASRKKAIGRTGR